MPLPQDPEEAARGFSQAESEMLAYLRNLAAKFYRLEKQVKQLKEGQECLQSSVLKLGEANCIAYGRVKKIVNTLAERTSEITSDLSTALGTCRTCDFDPDSPFADDCEDV